MPDLELRGARENNLREIDLSLPLGAWISVVGPSGSGKTSLVFDSLVREGQRRYLGALSARARRYLGKLGRAQLSSISGVPATIAVGQRALSAHARSTVGTLSGVLDLLRLLFARTAVDPQAQALSRSHFSFNHPDGACESCKGLGVEDQVDPALLIADERKSLRDGALLPTLKSGYTVYSQVTLEVMDQICQAHGFDVHTPWAELTQAQRDVVLYGTRALKVPFGKHSIASRMRWEGITARPREEGYYRGIVPVIRETLGRDRNPNILRYVRSVACSECRGTRLGRPGREARVGARTLPGLLALPVPELLQAFDSLPASPVLEALLPSLCARLVRMERLGLSHLSQDRASTTLSGGEGQRLRLAAQLSAGLSGMLIALDEPTLGLHPESQRGMQAVLQELRALGNTLLVVEHDPDMVRYADHLLAIGPGAGPQGGALLYGGPLALGPGGQDPLGRAPEPKRCPRMGGESLVLRGASLHTLQQVDLKVELGAFNLVMGPSGAGKSSLVFGTLLPALSSKRGGPYRSLEGVPAKLKVQSVDASPIGRTPRSTPATWSGLMDLVRRRFAATDQARQAGVSASRFSYNNKTGRCERCEGLGSVRVGLHLLQDVEVQCAVCGGGRYRPELLEFTLRGQSIAQVLGMRASEALEFFAQDPPVAKICQAMVELGLGYLRLGQSSTTLSRGEAQRVKLATLIAKASGAPSLLLMDEPDRGLHPQDVERLLRAIEALIQAGHTVLAISHHRHLWAAADHRVELRDGAIVPPQPLSSRPLSVHTVRTPAAPPSTLRLSGVSTHNLQNIDVQLPHRRLNVIVGPSGSGKSALAFGTLAAESWARFSESLPFQVRRFMRRMPKPVLASASGLTPTLSLRQREGRAGGRSTVATQSGVGPSLRLLWSRVGALHGNPSGLSAAAFSPDHSLGACPACEGTGALATCSPERLISHPERSLIDGAMAGTKPGRFFGEPDGQYMATLRAVLGDVDLSRPWRELPAQAQQVALYGAGERVVAVSWRFQRGARSGEHTFQGPWQGLCALVEHEARLRAKRKAGAQWAAPLVDGPCPECGGERLSAAARAVVVGGRRLPEVLAMPLDQVVLWLGELQSETALSTEQRAAAQAIAPELLGALGDLCCLGLSHLRLDRSSATLSDGELQRVRLASVLRSGMTGLTVVLDEPSAGLHSQDVEHLVGRLRALVAQGNTVVVVDHRPDLIRAADHLLELGPGAGPEGGQIVAQGPAQQVLSGQSLTARALRSGVLGADALGAGAPLGQGTLAGEGSALGGLAGTHSAGRRAPGSLGDRSLRIVGAHLHNLRDLEVCLPESGVVVVTGPSGSGKSSLVFGVVGASAQAGVARGCAGFQGLERFAQVRTPRSVASTPLDAMGLLRAMQALYFSVGAGPAKRAFSFRSPAGRCPACKGTGRETVAMDFLADLALPCPACEGQRYRPEVLAVRWRGLSPAAFLDTPAAALGELLPPGRLLSGVQSMQRVGLGHLGLGRDSATLSGGEVQRLVLAESLVQSAGPTLHLLDEPAKGLHEADIAGLVELLRALAKRGDLVLASAHRRSLIQAADWVVELGPGAGPRGGLVVGQGAPVVGS